MDFLEIVSKLSNAMPVGAIQKTEESIEQPRISIQKQYLISACKFLQCTEGLYFDFLSNLSAIDNGVNANSFEVIFHLYSIPYNHHFIIRVELPRTLTPETKSDFVAFEDYFLPSIPSIIEIWKSADWHEREAFDLMGIWFEGHPDLRRILMPADWKGHPLRKDYQNLETYHGIKVAY